MQLQRRMDPIMSKGITVLIYYNSICVATTSLTSTSMEHRHLEDKPSLPKNL